MWRVSLPWPYASPPASAETDTTRGHWRRWWRMLPLARPGAGSRADLRAEPGAPVSPRPAAAMRRAPGLMAGARHA